MASLNSVITYYEFFDLLQLIHWDTTGRIVGERQREQYYTRGDRTHQNIPMDKYNDNVIEMGEYINKTFKQEKKVKNIMLYPIGFVANCHGNSSKFVALLNARREKEVFEVVKGYNITTCACKQMVSTEIHSVIRHIESGSLFDITDDFDMKLEFKMFIEVEFLTKYYEFIIHKRNTRGLDCIFNIPQHRCPLSGQVYVAQGADYKFGQLRASKTSSRKEFKIRLADLIDSGLEEYKTPMKQCWDILINNRKACVYAPDMNGMEPFRWKKVKVDGKEKELYDFYNYPSEIGTGYKPPSKYYTAKKVEAEENMSKEETLNTFLVKPNDNNKSKKKSKSKKKGRK